MADDLKSRIKQAETLASAGEEDAAMAIANELVECAPNDERVWSLRAYLHSRSRDYQAAVSDWARAIEIAPEETHLFFSRGWRHLRLGNHSEALADFNRGLELCDFHQNDYYRTSLHFLRAEALVRLGRTQEALVDLDRVPEDFQWWFGELRTKEDLLAECKRTNQSRRPKH